jgi:hypothetical protein
MKPVIEVFVHSVSSEVDYESAREMSRHGFCNPGTAMKAGEIVSQFNKVKGRVFSEENWAVLQRLIEVAGPTSGEVRLYDVSRMLDRLKALSRGVIKTPVVIINGEKSEGAEKCLDALSNCQPR